MVAKKRYYRNCVLGFALFSIKCVLGCSIYHYSSIHQKKPNSPQIWIYFSLDPKAYLNWEAYKIWVDWPDIKIKIDRQKNFNTKKAYAIYIPFQSIIQQGFPYWEDGWSSPPPAKNLLFLPPPWKIPPPNFYFSTKLQFSCYNPIKSSVSAPVFNICGMLFLALKKV